MTNWNRREALRGAEEETFGLLAQVWTSKEWAELLKAPLERTANKGHIRDLAQKLLEPNRDAREALRGGEIQAFDLLVEVLTSKQWAELLKAPLKRAAHQGNRDLAQKLVKAGAEIGDALHAAVRGGHADVVNDLLENGASVAAIDTSYGGTPLHDAARSGKTEMVQLLLRKQADKDAMDNEERTPLFDAARCGCIAAGLALLAAGADISLRDRERTILHAAARGGNVAIVKAAIERGMDLNVVDLNERTPLHDAAIYNEAEATDVLVEAGANTEARCDTGRTPLHYAAGVEPSLKALVALLKHGAHVNAQDNTLKTPLHWAAGFAEESGVTEAVDLLLRYGADETILNDEGEAAVDVVGMYRDESEPRFEYADSVIELLTNAPADRAWRRRGYLVLCRAHSDRLQQKQNISIVTAGVARRTRSKAKLTATKTGSCSWAVGTSPVDELSCSGGDWTVVVARLLGLQEEGLFRTIVGYL